MTSNTQNANKLRQGLENARLKDNNKENYNKILLEQIPSIETRLVLLENKVKEMCSKDKGEKIESKENKERDEKMETKAKA
ncbi:hypothetical protein [Helicobacter trogontum]|uniref:Uncharacterized protein n=1 Tax=Helicobacter trogontum TaxID=50960 RepID=A0A099VB23_9HELI|nr:hypothetical protein [Helicobacter trogontum]TLD81304.1 hypothetical protein LS81_008680 [Helicobacter trogontum]